MRRRQVAGLAAVVGAVLACAAAAPTTATAGRAASPPGSDPTVGPLFASAEAPTHYCTASVVHSSGHDLLLTAAHCITGTGAGTRFAPGYRDGRSPLGRWVVVRAWASPRWLADQDPRADVAVLQVAPQRLDGREVDVEDLTGGAALAPAPAPGTPVTVAGYRAGADDAAVRCTAATTDTRGYPTFTCPGYTAGTSGSPFTTSAPGRRRALVGVIGGLQQGGCTDDTSYSSPFGADAQQLLRAAEVGRPGDDLPAAGGSGCPLLSW